ncbi:MAG: hypothetical protein IJ711_02755, partial [Lachnospiraceae bacterium]|nr:hypothetical protein [Lachnospiraceae bacterium]
QDMKSDIENLKSDMKGMKSDIQNLKSDIEDIRQKTTKMSLVIENELRINIQRIAEGHLDLSRNLHDAMRPSNEVEMLSIKVRMMESELKDLRDTVSNLRNRNIATNYCAE